MFGFFLISILFLKAYASCRWQYMLYAKIENETIFELSECKESHI